MNRKITTALLALAFPLCSLCCTPYVCTSVACGGPSPAFSLTPGSIELDGTTGHASSPVSVVLSGGGAAGLGYTIGCNQGVIATPSSGTVSTAQSATVSFQAPSQSTASTSTAICFASSPEDNSVTVQLTIKIVITGSSSGGSGVGTSGGSVDHLYFAVVGDSRPENIDDTANYPTAVITKIYQDVQAISPAPQFVIGTGDYMYANTNANTAQPQAQLYMQARAAWTGTFFPAMGNHECDGYTADNCTVNQTQNNQAFMSLILAPSNQSLPYYSIPINSTDGSWTSKLIVVACNAWDSTQQTWLTSTLAESTTYTFLVRHEPAEANTGPCVNTVEQMMAQSSYDLSIVGHTHEFKGSSNSKEIVVGNGGAPLDDHGNYGYATIERLSGGWQIKNYDYSTALPVTTYLIP